MAMVRDQRRRANILGVGIDAIDLDAAVARVENWIVSGNSSYAVFRDVHGVMLCQRDERLRCIHNNSGMVGADGIPLAWLMRRKFGAGVGRVYGPDFMLAFCRQTAGKRYRHYFYGAIPSTIEKLVQRMSEIAPSLTVAGTMSPPFRDLTDEEDAAVVETINAARPDIVWVGLSTPKQEYWMANHLGRLSASALMGVGAAFDFISGQKPQAPLWMQRSGLEWSFRLGTEPRRLAKRYLRNVPAFLVLAAAQAVGWKRYNIS
jgi:N-acetylglucosaminyldiphosphoundecaprenol N-acetyl-beta-D-mannosaminyltransferase